MNLSRDLTLLIGLDRQHLDELRISLPTWEKLRPEILDIRTVIVRDPELPINEIHAFFNRFTTTVLHVPTGEFSSHRERMLTALVHAPREIKTDWFLKLDSDLIATKPGPLIERWWLDNRPVFVAPRWSYTKPANAIDTLNTWANSIPELANRPALKVPYRPNDDRVYHPRISSHFFLGRTRWCAAMSRLLGDKLPVPSHDTCLHYVAARRGDYFMRIDDADNGWRHVGSDRIGRLKEEAQQVLSRHGNHTTATAV